MTQKMDEDDESGSGSILPSARVFNSGACTCQSSLDRYQVVP